VSSASGIRAVINLPALTSLDLVYAGRGGDLP
jgi:hypothetical protein